MTSPGIPTQPAEVSEVSYSIPGYDEFEIDIEKVMRAQLPERFESVPAARLGPESISLLPARAKGAYMLFHSGRPVYAGKTDTRHGFRDRLTRHHFTLQHRHGVDIADMSFKAVRIMVFSNFDVEAILIHEMRKADSAALPWNDTGFGSNDPGHNREFEEPGDFDRANFINIDRLLDPPLLSPGEIPLLDALIAMKEGLPYTFRYETDLRANNRPSRYTQGHSDYQLPTSVINIPAEPLTLRNFLMLALAVLPDGWRATVFPGRVILYKEVTAYQYAIEAFTR